MAVVSVYDKIAPLLKGADPQELGRIRDLAKELIREKTTKSDSPYISYEERTIIVKGKKDFKFTDYDIEDFERIFFHSDIKDWGALEDGVEYIIFKRNLWMDQILKQRQFKIEARKPKLGDHDLEVISIAEYEKGLKQM